jgi:predicted dehydrogenase
VTSAAGRRPLRWLVVGAGAISHKVVPDLAQLDGVEVAAVHSRDAAKAAAFAAQHGIPRSSDDRDALLDDPTIDAVYIATPFATHHAVVHRGLVAGKHVLVEKPMARSRAEVDDLFRTAGERGLFVMEAMWTAFNPAFRLLLELLASGRIGRPRSMRAGFGFPLPDDGGSRWDADRSGSVLLDQGINAVMLAHSFFGDPVEVWAGGHVRPDGVDLAEHVTLEFAAGEVAQFAASQTEFVDPSASISGTRGWITVPGMFWSSTTLRLHADSWDRMFGDPEVIELPREGNGYVPMLRAVSDAIRAGSTQHLWHDAARTSAVFTTLDRIRADL